MENLWETFLKSISIDLVVQSVITVLIGLILIRSSRAAITRFGKGRVSSAHTLLARRFVTTGLLALTLAAVLEQNGLKMSVLFGAAGIFSLALGFASQTSASNLIAGIFLIGDNTFTLGDVITVGGVTGEVIAIDLLSVKLRKFDNVLVRIPNETLIKTQVETLTRYPIRRIELKLRLPYDESVEKLTEALFAAADRDPYLLQEPRPTVSYSGFVDSGLELTVLVWTARENFLSVKNNLQANILDEIGKRGIRLAVHELHVDLAKPALLTHTHAARPEDADPQ